MRALLLLPLFALAGCSASFEQDFAETEQQLKAEAERLDRELANPPADDSAAGN